MITANERSLTQDDDGIGSLSLTTWMKLTPRKPTSLLFLSLSFSLSLSSLAFFAHYFRHSVYFLTLLFFILIILFIVSDCEVSDWGLWSDCDVQCGLGSMKRERKVLREAKNGGKSCPELTQKRGCNGVNCMESRMASNTVKASRGKSLPFFHSLLLLLLSLSSSFSPPFLLSCPINHNHF